MTTNWEYRVEQFNNIPEDVKKLNEVLNKLGADGWELVQVTGPIGASGAVGNKFYFKRPKAVQAAAQSNFGH
jgi:hypothetical protein